MGTEIQRFLSHLSMNYMVLISSLIWVGIGGSSPQIISSTIFCVDELPNIKRFPTHDFELNILWGRYAYDDRLTKLTFFGVVRDKW